MANSSEHPDSPAPSSPPADSASPRFTPARLLAVGGAVVLGSCLAGLVGGLVWVALAPRAVYQVASQGLAYVLNPETSAFIAGDLWYCLIGVIGGALIGLLGYLLAVRRYGPVPMAAIVAGSLAAAFAARWVGQSWGVARFNRELALGHAGTLLTAPLVLGGDTAQVLWPALAAWPLAACLVAGGLVLFGRHRQLATAVSRTEARRRATPSQIDWPQWPGRESGPGSGDAAGLTNRAARAAAWVRMPELNPAGTPSLLRRSLHR